MAQVASPAGRPGDIRSLGALDRSPGGKSKLVILSCLSHGRDSWEGRLQKLVKPFVITTGKAGQGRRRRRMPQRQRQQRKLTRRRTRYCPWCDNREREVLEGGGSAG